MKILKYHGSNNFSYKTCNLVIYQNIILKILTGIKKLVRNLRVIFDLISLLPTVYPDLANVWTVSAFLAFLAEFQAVVHDWFR